MIILIIVVNNFLVMNDIKMVVYELVLNKCLIFCHQNIFFFAVVFKLCYSQCCL